MREIHHAYQQFALLEDHARELASSGEACPDCLFKHSNKSVGYSMEVASLVTKRDKTFWLGIADDARKIRKRIFDQGPPRTTTSNPRLYEPYALTKQEKRDKARVKGICKPSSKNRYCRLVRCIQKVEPKEDDVESAAAVCRATIYAK